MRIEPYDYQYVHVQPEDCKEIVERTILEGKPVERLFYRDNNTVCPHPDDIPFLNQQTRIVLENCGKSMRNLSKSILLWEAIRHLQK